MICIPKFGGGGGRNNIGGASTELEDSGYEAEGVSMGERFDPVAKDHKKKQKKRCLIILRNMGRTKLSFTII